MRWLAFLIPLLLPSFAHAASDPNDCAARFAHLKEIQYSREFEAEALKSVRDPAVNAERLREEMAEVWSSPRLSVREKTQITFDHYFEARLADMPADRQALARQALAGLKQRDIPGGYSPRKGELELAKAYKNHDVAFYAFLTHELEHLDQFGSQAHNMAGRFPPDWEQQFSSRVERLLERARIFPTASQMRRMVTYEPEAIGAEWDLLQAIPREARKEAGEKFLAASRNFLDRLDRKVLAKDLELADLSREEYIQQVSSLHGYSLGSPLKQQAHLWTNRIVRTIAFAAFANAGCMATPGCTPYGPPPPWKEKARRPAPLVSVPE